MSVVKSRSPWLFRFELDPNKLQRKDISIETIENKFREELENEDVKNKNGADSLSIIYHHDFDIFSTNSAAPNTRSKLKRQVFRLRVPDV